MVASSEPVFDVAFRGRTPDMLDLDPDPAAVAVVPSRSNDGATPLMFRLRARPVSRLRRVAAHDIRRH